MAFRLPDNTKRTAVMGRTGTGKTLAGSWLLSRMHFHRQPWIIIDTKYDHTILNDIEATEIGLRDSKLPRHAGLYIVHPTPHELEDLERFLWKVWQQERVGLFGDEGYMLPNSSPTGRGAFQALLTQGRSKKIPMIILAQRPAWISRFLWSESDYHWAFPLQSKTDLRNVRDFFPDDFEQRLPRYWSRWHDVSEGTVNILKPVPDRDTVMQLFRDRQAEVKGQRGWARKYILHGPLRIGSLSS